MHNIQNIHQNKIDKLNNQIKEKRLEIENIETKIGYRDNDNQPYKYRKDKFGRCKWNKIQDLYPIELQKREKLLQDIYKIREEITKTENPNIELDLNDDKTLEDIRAEIINDINKRLKENPLTKENKEKAKILRERSDELSQEAWDLEIKIGYYAPDHRAWNRHRDKEGRKRWEYIQDTYKNELKEIEEKRKLSMNLNIKAKNLDLEHFRDVEIPNLINGMKRAGMDEEILKFSLIHMYDGGLVELAGLDEEAIETEYKKVVK